MPKTILPDIDLINASVEKPSGNDQSLAIPVVWLLGKVQSGKSSIVRHMTASDEAEIGNGYKACTKTSRAYDFPPSAPIIRFLDTRGLGEAAYDPAEDLKVAEKQSHLLLVTMRAMDQAQSLVVEAVSKIRQEHPEWPIVVAQTCLHEGYKHGQQHQTSYPHGANIPAEPGSDLYKSLTYQRSLFQHLPGRKPPVFVAIDFTHPSDALDPPDYGIDALADALMSAAPQGLRIALRAMPITAHDARIGIADPVILGHAIAAAGSDLVPVAGAIASSAVQARLLQRLGQIYGVEWNRRNLGELSAALGSGVAARALIGLGVRQLAKMIPIYGQTIALTTSAAMSFAVTYAIGKAASYYLAQRQRGLSIDGTAEIYQKELRNALKMAKERAFAASEKQSRP